MRERDSERGSDGEKLDSLADSNCEVKIIRSSVSCDQSSPSHLIINTGGSD